MPYDITIPEPVLDKADRITLKDLLQSPSFQCFIVSAVGNGVRNASAFSEVSDEADEFLQFRLHQLMGSIPYETRRACFDEVGRIFRERKDERYDR
jgi:hypothetical protein|tara:strand:+ start:4903 stop:5190 length:288 start_codon:yes stop_codon:yes gene_type:complete